MSISAKLVMQLRAKTGAGMMDCKKALLETNGEFEAAITYLREKGISKAAKKADRVAAEGLVFVAVSEDKKTGALIEFNSETDFVAKNEDFLNLGNAIANLTMTNNVKNIEDILALEIEGVSVSTTITNLISRIGENMNLRRFERYTSEGFVTTYLHMGGRIGVLLNASGEPTEDNIVKAKDICMHTAAMNPSFFDKSEVTQEALDKERAILKNQLIEQGKPEKIIDNILIGKMNKFFEENCLLQQKFVKDDKQTVEQYGKDLKISAVARFQLGDGIEKEEKDFAAEVAEQIKG